MSVTIDSLQIEIQTSSSNAAGGIDRLAASLERLKKVGSYKVAIDNLGKLSSSLKGFEGVSSACSNLKSVAEAIEALKKAGSIGSIGSGIERLSQSLAGLQSVDVGSVAPKIRKIANALTPLNNVKGGGFNSMMSGLSKLGEVTNKLDDATINNFVSRIKELDKKLGPVSSNLVAVSNAIRNINTNAKGAGTSVGHLGSKVNATTLNMASMITVIRGVVAALRPVITLISNCVGEAIEWDGIAQRFGRGFGDQAQETYEWIQKLNKEMGINTQQFMQYSSTYATMLKGFGVASEDASKMALGYMELTYDVWSGYNDIYKSLDDAATAIRSAIAGEVEPVRKAGFTIIESTLEQTAANHGLKISLEKATEAQKSYLRYLTMVDQAKAQDLVGNYAREMNTAEGVMRTFNQQLKSLGQTFGSIFLPILVKIMPYLQTVIELLGDGIRALATFFGVEIQKVDFGSSVGGLGDSADSATSAVEGTTKAMKELKNATLGIDELNVISPQDKSGSGSGGGAGGFDNLDIGSLWDESIFDDVQSKVSGIKGTLQEWLGLTGDIDGWTGFLETKLGRILSLVGLIGIGIAGWKVTKSFIDAIIVLKTLVSSPTYSIAVGVTLTLVGFALEAAALKSAVEIGLDGLNFAEIVAGGLVGTGGMAILGSKIATWISSAFAGSAVDLAITQAGINLGVGTAGAAGAALSAAVGGIIAGIPAYFVGLYDAFTNGLDWLNGLLIPAGSSAAGAGIGAIIGACGGPIGAGIGALIGLAVGLVSDGIVLIVQEWDNITAFFKKLFTETIPGLWNDFKTWLGNLPQSIEKWFDDLWQPVRDFDWKQFGYDAGQKAGEAVKEICRAVKTFFTETIPEVWSSVIESTKTFFTKTLPEFFTKTIPEFFETVKTEFITFFTQTLPQSFSGIGEWFDDVGAAIWGGIEDGWYARIDAISDWIDGFVQGFKDALGIHSPSTVFRDEIGKNCLSGLIDALDINAIKERISSMWESAKSWWSKSKSALASYTPSIGSIKDKLSSAWTTAKTWWSNNVKLSIPSLSFKVTYTTKGLNAVQRTIVNALGLSGWPKLSFAASGGIFDTGSLVWAGEAGPEIVANAGGGKTGVMNVQQMSEAVYEGVYSAVVAAMRAAGGNNGNAQSVNVYLDGREITASVERRQHERGASLMGNQVYSY